MSQRTFHFSATAAACGQTLVSAACATAMPPDLRLFLDSAARQRGIAAGGGCGAAPCTCSQAFNLYPSTSSKVIPLSADGSTHTRLQPATVLCVETTVRCAQCRRATAAHARKNAGAHPCSGTAIHQRTLLSMRKAGMRTHAWGLSGWPAVCPAGPVPGSRPTLGTPPGWPAACCTRHAYWSNKLRTRAGLRSTVQAEDMPCIAPATPMQGRSTCAQKTSSMPPLHMPRYQVKGWSARAYQQRGRRDARGHSQRGHARLGGCRDARRRLKHGGGAGRLRRGLREPCRAGCCRVGGDPIQLCRLLWAAAHGVHVCQALAAHQEPPTMTCMRGCKVLSALPLAHRHGVKQRAGQSASRWYT